MCLNEFTYSCRVCFVLSFLLRFLLLFSSGDRVFFLFVCCCLLSLCSVFALCYLFFVRDLYLIVFSFVVVVLFCVLLFSWFVFCFVIWF